MRYLRLLVLAVVIGVAFAPAPANADPVTVEFRGGIFGLELLGNVGGDNYWVRYTADLESFDSQVGSEARWDKYVSAIAFKVGVDVQDAELTDTNVGPITDWTIDLSGWMSNSGFGCASGSVSALCTEVSPQNSFVAPTTGNSYSWTFLVTTTGDVPTVFGQPIRAQFINEAGEPAGLLSMTTATVPEPASMLLFGTGLIGAGLLGRRRRNR